MALRNKIGICFLCVALIAFANNASAAPILLSFDDIKDKTYTPVPSTYNGFTFSSGWYVDTNSYYRTVGNTYNFPSNPNAAFNFAGVQKLTLSNSVPFNFDSAYFWAFTVNNSFSANSASSLTISGYNGNNLIGSIKLSLPTRPILENIRLNGVDRLVFTRNGTPSNVLYWFMDNFQDSLTAVPEADTLWLLLTGLSGLLSITRRPKKLGER
ncbi:MAG: hypothetical protein ABSB79_11400 [Syntrophales bacterium]|jgi:hypothetical protein